MLWRNRSEEQRTVSEFPRVLLALSTEPKHHLCLGGVGACSTHQLAAIKQAAVQVRALDAINQSALSVCSDKPSSAAGRIWVAKQRPPATRVRHLELHHTAGWAGGQLRFAWLTCGIKKSTFHNFLTAQKPCPRGTATLELRFGQFPVFAFSAGAVRGCATHASRRGPGRRAPPQGTAFFAYIPVHLNRKSCRVQYTTCRSPDSHLLRCPVSRLHSHGLSRPLLCWAGPGRRCSLGAEAQNQAEFSRDGPTAPKERGAGTWLAALSPLCVLSAGVKIPDHRRPPCSMEPSVHRAELCIYLLILPSSSYSFKAIHYSSSAECKPPILILDTVTSLLPCSRPIQS